MSGQVQNLLILKCYELSGTTRSCPLELTDRECPGGMIGCEVSALLPALTWSTHRHAGTEEEKTRDDQHPRRLKQIPTDEHTDRADHQEPIEHHPPPPVE
jgi:hypothetical protein